MLSLTEILKRKEILLLDGAMGTALMAAGVSTPLEDANITNPDLVTSIHRGYVEAGSQMVITNTLGVNRFRMKNDEYSVRELSVAGIECARQAQPAFVGFSIGPTGVIFGTSTQHTYEDAYEAYSEVAEIVVDLVDVVYIETMYDLRETQMAIQAIRDTCNVPIFVTLTFGGDDRIMSGEGPQEIARTLVSMGILALGTNCSGGPQQITRIVREMREVTDLPLIAKPNAGLPHKGKGEKTYGIGPAQFGDEMMRALRAGATVIGGCCGTTHEHIAQVAQGLK